MDFIKQEDGKKCLTTLFSGTASGVLLPLLFVFDAKNVKEEWKRYGPKGSLYTTTAKGWMTTEALCDGYVDMLGDYFDSLENNFPRLLLLDNCG